MIHQLNVYVAAPWAFKNEAKEIVARLRQEGFGVSSRWIEAHADKPADSTGLEWDLAQLQQEAKEDLTDVRNSQVVLLFNTQKRGEETSGKAVEMGYALSQRIPIICVGEHSNVFHKLPQVKTVKSFEEALELLKVMSSVVDWIYPL